MEDKLYVYTLRIYRQDAAGFNTLSESTYSELFRQSDKDLTSGVTFKKPIDMKVNSIYYLDVLALTKKIISILSKKKNNKCHVLLIEFLDEEADVRAYDDLSNSIKIAIQDNSTVKPWSIVISITNKKLFSESLCFYRELIPDCEHYKIGLVMLSWERGSIELELFSKGTFMQEGKLLVLEPCQQVKQKEETAIHCLTEDEITQEFRILFGHFEVNYQSKIFHLTAIASVRKLANNDVFIQQLRKDISDLIGNTEFTVCYFGPPFSSIRDLSSALVDGDINRLYDPKSSNNDVTLPLIFLCDFLSPVYPIEGLFHRLTEKGFRIDAVIAIASYNNVSIPCNLKKHIYIKTNFEAFLVEDSSCTFCKQGVDIIKGENLEDYARQIGEFDTFTFWEFVSLSNDFYQVGHWVSPITPNHYHFRIDTLPLFRRYLYCLSVRLKNTLKKNIMLDWIHKIICIEGEESTILSKGLAEELGLDTSKDVITIPRKYIHSTVAGKELEKDLQSYIVSTYGIENLKRCNVIIIDQAAHHFKTQTYLRIVCDFYECTALAFVVFLDRTSSELPSVDYLHHMHYTRLYSWSVTPHRSHDCQCSNKE